MSEESSRLGRNLRRYELAVAIVFMALLIAVFMDRMQALEAQAERAGFDLFVGTLRERIRIQNVVLRAGKSRGRVIDLAGGNPIQLFMAGGARPDWLGETVPIDPPSGYRGETDRAREGVPAPGEWVFERRRRALTYRVRGRGAFGLDRDQSDLIRFALAVDYLDSNGNGYFDPGVDAALGLKLERLKN